MYLLIYIFIYFITVSVYDSFRLLRSTLAYSHDQADDLNTSVVK